MSDLYIGLMSGTSLDGIDGVLVDLSGDTVNILAHAYTPYPDTLRAILFDLNSLGHNELHRAALAENSLARAYASVVKTLVQTSGIGEHLIQAIGNHGQTVRHRPQEFDNDASVNLSGGYTIQLNNSALLAELSGIDVVSDFRRRDVAAGGQGAPLVPAFHAALFGQDEHCVAVLNIGGIANISLLEPRQGQPLGEVTGFDCGPGNALMDFWCQNHLGKAYDESGRWAASGHIHAGLLASLLEDPYFEKPPPKSTGRDLFNPSWLNQKLLGFSAVSAVDVQATLAELTAVTCCRSLLPSRSLPRSLIVCGGGALNSHLMSRLADLSSVPVESSERHGLAPLQVEATAFAWLARQCVQREPGNIPKATGARGARILGAIYPA